MDGGLMASRRKKSPKKKKSSRSRSAQSPLGNKIIARVLIGIVLVVVLFEGVKMFLAGPPKNIKVQQILRVTGEQKTCGRFNSWGIAPVGKEGKFIVADQENGRLLLFDRQGKFLKAWGKAGSGPNDFHEPSGMTADEN